MRCRINRKPKEAYRRQRKPIRNHWYGKLRRRINQNRGNGIEIKMPQKMSIKLLAHARRIIMSYNAVLPAISKFIETDSWANASFREWREWQGNFLYRTKAMAWRPRPYALKKRRGKSGLGAGSFSPYAGEPRRRRSTAGECARERLGKEASAGPYRRAWAGPAPARAALSWPTEIK